MDLSFFNSVMFWFGLIVIVRHIPLICRYIYIKIFCKGMSNMRTAPEVGAKVVEIIKADIVAKGKMQDYRIVDLGSAFGYYSCQLAQALPGAHITGMDCDPGGVAFSKALAKKMGLKNVEFYKGDFFEVDLSQYDAIVFYLPYFLMERMGEVLREKVKPGTLIISNRFQLQSGWEPTEVLQIETAFNKQGRLNIYRR